MVETPDAESGSERGLRLRKLEEVLPNVRRRGLVSPEEEVQQIWFERPQGTNA